MANKPVVLCVSRDGCKYMDSCADAERCLRHERSTARELLPSKVMRYRIQQNKGEYCLKGCADGDLVDYDAYAALESRASGWDAVVSKLMALDPSIFDGAPSPLECVLKWIGKPETEQPLLMAAKALLSARDDAATVAATMQLREAVAGSDNPHVVTQYQRGFDDGFRRATEGFRSETGDECTGKHGSQVECDIVRDQRNRIQHLERQLALSAELEKAMEESIGVKDGQTFEQRAEELGVTEVSAENLYASFKNFHRLLCERFDYAHDDKDWQRDQLSLIEHIAQGGKFFRAVAIQELRIVEREIGERSEALAMIGLSTIQPRATNSTPGLKS